MEFREEKKKNILHTKEGRSARCTCDVYFSISVYLFSLLYLLSPFSYSSHPFQRTSDPFVCRMRCMCTYVLRARILYRTFVCIQISVKRVHTHITYVHIDTRGIRSYIKSLCQIVIGRTVWFWKRRGNVPRNKEKCRKKDRLKWTKLDSSCHVIYVNQYLT